jgi:hypothetical protein
MKKNISKIYNRQNEMYIFSKRNVQKKYTIPFFRLCIFNCFYQPVNA